MMDFCSINYKHIVFFACLNVSINGCSPGWEIINPYQNIKKYPYKASLHNHSFYHPDYTHSRIPPDQRLRDYRDYPTQPEYGARNSALIYQPNKYKHAAHPTGVGRGVEEPLRILSEDGSFLVLAHPNARLETKGEHLGNQIWTSAGYTYEELDIIFGNPEKDIEPLSYLPHALEIGNSAYDFSPRTDFRNAEDKWDYLLKQGHRIMGIASDDSHGKTRFMGWIVVYTTSSTREELTLENVMESLFSGNFYSSQGPNMDIAINEKQFTIKTDHPSLIEFISNGEVNFFESNSLVATYSIRGNEGYIRGRVTREDKEWEYIEGGIGRYRSAWTNPLYIIKKNSEN